MTISSIIFLLLASTNAEHPNTLRRLLQAEPPQTTRINGELYLLFSIAPGQTQLVPVIQGVTQNPPPQFPPPANPVNPVNPITPIQSPTTEAPTRYPTQPTAPQPPVPAPQPITGSGSGAYGQVCNQPSGTAQCQSTTDFVIDTAANTPPNQISCATDWDCCLCDYIQCGEATAGGRACEFATFAGNNAAFGVKNIQIYGDPNPANGAATMIECAGDYSCAHTAMQTQGITELNCVGRHSCEGAVIYVEDPGLEFTLECGVTSACENLSIVLEITKPANTACTNAGTFVLDNIACVGVDSCKGLSFTVINNGCDNVVVQSIECREGTCNGASFNWYGTSPIGVSSCIFPPQQAMDVPGLERCFSHLQNYLCGARESCMNQLRTLIDPVNGFRMECSDRSSCAGSSYSIQVSAAAEYTEPTTFYEIKCTGTSACRGMWVDIVNLNAVPVQVDILCQAEGACNDALFTSRNNVVITDVLCDTVEQCDRCTFDGKACGGFGPK
eukprot:CAMPEP_0197049988 /NCGR_PEP_ID=MMETSP1384-20130603/24994_1 /TAXON_ID=29189 /ORGANISM="Ammonia sp." /LENGTH=499 /DNA_ID=CAMNT_0042482343 /DNA_START=105 /DNA_END=1604 /DNA_ORIENTATION=+